MRRLGTPSWRGEVCDGGEWGRDLSLISCVSKVGMTD